jgi:hypothetical protein
MGPSIYRYCFRLCFEGQSFYDVLELSPSYNWYEVDRVFVTHSQPSFCGFVRLRTKAVQQMPIADLIVACGLDGAGEPWTCVSGSSDGIYAAAATENWEAIGTLGAKHTGVKRLYKISKPDQGLRVSALLQSITWEGEDAFEVRIVAAEFNEQESGCCG